MELTDDLPHSGVPKPPRAHDRVGPPHGKLLVERSRDPECDAARALLAKGLTSKLTMLDGKTGKPRTVIDIEKAAQLMVSEENIAGFRFRKRPSTTDNSPPSPVTASPDEEAA
jgi:hypothetical protein